MYFKFKAFSTLMILFCFFISSCASIEFKTPSITQPIVFGNKITIDGKDLPKEATMESNVKGYVIYSKSEDSQFKYTTEKANADIDFENHLNKMPNRCITGLQLYVKTYIQFFGYATSTEIEYTGTCYQIPISK